MTLRVVWRIKKYGRYAVCGKCELACERAGGSAREHAKIDNMNVLFVCQANVGRSQVAMELYRQRGGKADSAGTKVDQPGQVLADRPGATIIVDVMRASYGIDMSRNTRTQITPARAAGHDKLVVMAEPETIPAWLDEDSRTLRWIVDDPKGQDEATTRMIVCRIEREIEAISDM